MKKASFFILRSQRGITLLELILLIIILGIAILSSMKMMSAGLNSSMSVETHIKAANLANSKMEQIFADKKSKGYAYIDNENYPTETNPDDITGFTRTVQITSQSTYKKIVVTVSHQDLSDFVLTAVVTNY